MLYSEMMNLAHIEEKIDFATETIIEGMDHVYEKLDTKIDGLERKIDNRIDGLTETMVAGFDRVYERIDERMDRMEKDMGLIKTHLGIKAETVQ